MFRFFFFFNDTATTEIYTLSLHDALPIRPDREHVFAVGGRTVTRELVLDPVRDDPDLLVRHAEQLDELSPGELRDRDDAPGRVQDARDDTRAVGPRPAVEGVR